MCVCSKVAWTIVDQSKVEARALHCHFKDAWSHNKWLLLHAMSHSPSMCWENFASVSQGFGVPQSMLADADFCFFAVQRSNGFLPFAHPSVQQNFAFAWSCLNSWREHRCGPFPIELVPEALLNDTCFVRALVVRHQSVFGRLPEAMRQVWEVAYEAVVHWPYTHVPHVPSPLRESSSFWVHICHDSPGCRMRLPQAVAWDRQIWMHALLQEKVPGCIPPQLDDDDGRFVKEFLIRCHDMKLCPGWRLTRVYLFDPTRTRLDEYWLLLLRAARTRQIVHYTLQWMPWRLLHFVGWCFKLFHSRYYPSVTGQLPVRPYWFRSEALAPCSFEMANIAWASAVSTHFLRLVHPGMCGLLSQCVRVRLDLVPTLLGVGFSLPHCATACCRHGIAGRKCNGVTRQGSQTL